jgi:glycosyltransferase involved in cell wall biosynthesis
VNLLILHQHFQTPQTGGALRSYFLAKAAIEAGHTVHVVTGSSHNQYHVTDQEGITVHAVPVQYSNYFGFWKRIFAFVAYVGWCVRLSRTFKQVDVCYAISVPLSVGWAARWLKWRHGVPYIFEVGDLWPDAPIALDVIQHSTLKKWLWAMERKIYREANSIIALSPAIAEAITSKVSTATVHMIPNMADTDFFQPQPKHPDLEKKFGVEGRMVVSYFGAMGFANGLEYLIKAAKACAEAQLPVHFLLAGDGVERGNLEKLARDLALSNVSFHSFQQRSGIYDLMNVTDVVLVCFRAAAILETGSPNKLFDGLAAGKLILVNFGGWLKHEVELTGCGNYIDPHNPAAVAALLQTLTPRQLMHAQQAARTLALNKYSRAELTKQWLAALETHGKGK